MRTALTLVAALLLSACSLSEPSSSTTVTVTAITLEALPAAGPDGAPWDESSPPDVYLEVQDALGRVYLTGGATDADALPTPMQAESARFSDLERQLFIFAVEQDPDLPSTEWPMVGATPAFSFDDVAEERPSSLRLTDADGAFCILLSLSWE